MLLEIPELLEEISPPAGLGLERARWVVEEMDRRRVAGPGAAPPSLLDPYGQPRHAFVEAARVIDVVASLLAFELFDLPTE